MSFLDPVLDVNTIITFPIYSLMNQYINTGIRTCTLSLQYLLSSIAFLYSFSLRQTLDLLFCINYCLFEGNTMCILIKAFDSLLGTGTIFYDV